MKTKYPNGFESWLDTFFHLTDLILSENWDKDAMTEVKHTQEFGGHSALKELAREWTNEFEKEYQTVDWEEFDFYETLEAFFNEKNKSAAK